MSYRGNYGPGRDNSMKYFNDGLSKLKIASSQDKAGQFAMAKGLYQQAKANFNLALNQPDISGQLKDLATNYVTQIDQRITEIDNFQQVPAQQINPDGTKNRPRPTKKGSGGGPPGSGGGGGNGGGGGGGNGGADDEANEFKDRISSAILVEKPNIKWSDVAGLAEAKRNLVQAVIMPLKIPQFFQGNRKPWRGILLYGPPGTGKSFLAKATATEANNSTFLTVSTSDLVSKWVGESEKLIRALFDTARSKTPAIIFIDEIDSLLSERSESDSESARRIKTEFLIQMDGVGKSMDGILLLAATNIPWGLDSAVRRRFEKKIYIPLPDFEARKALIKLKIKDTPTDLTDQQIDQLAQMTEGYSGADINILARDASMAPVNRIQQAQYFVMYNNQLWPCNPDQPGAVKATVLDMTPEQLKLLVPPNITLQDFINSLQKVKPSVSPKDLTKFDQWTQEFGTEGN